MVFIGGCSSGSETSAPTMSAQKTAQWSTLSAGCYEAAWAELYDLDDVSALCLLATNHECHQSFGKIRYELKKLKPELIVTATHDELKCRSELGNNTLVVAVDPRKEIPSKWWEISCSIISEKPTLSGAPDILKPPVSDSAICLPFYVARKPGLRGGEAGYVLVRWQEKNWDLIRLGPHLVF